MRVRISATQYVQPDLIVICGQPAFTDETDPSLTNPSVIIEILSPSTAGYDYSGKFQLYRQLPSFEEYLLVAQDQSRIGVFRRMNDGRWLLSSYEAQRARSAPTLLKGTRVRTKARARLRFARVPTKERRP
ncbi:MAG: Uma2 family endonuclease [Acidobacteria bacterium]|nr:Uma2 family endonuclease [Acidobacteriota bacterium]